ncbi:hypothetical protein vseg_011812 [Gypsophila vaccaria]
MEGKYNGNKTKQQITVPFVWEEKPGALKESWKTKRDPLTPVPQAVKYVASVPFKWEEKPGTPLSCFVQETKEHELENKSLPLPPAYFAKLGNESNGESSSGDDYDYEDWLSELDFETLSVLSEESFGSASSLPQASHPTHSRLPVSSAEPLYKPVPGQQKDGYLAGSASSEINNSSSCASRYANLRDSFLQYPSPLYPPKSDFLDKPSNSEETNNGPRLPTLEEYEKLKAEFRRNGVIRRPMTLGELIMQSRRRSYRQKAAQKKKKNSPKDSNEELRGCFNLGGSGLELTKLLRRDFLPLKLS